MLAYKCVMYDYELIELCFLNTFKVDLLDLEVWLTDKAAAQNVLCFLIYRRKCYQQVKYCALH